MTLSQPWLTSDEVLMKTIPPQTETPTLAQTVAGEDLQIGDYIAVLTQVSEVPSFLWGRCDQTWDRDLMLRVKFIPPEAGQPCKVIGLCLPFVYITRPHGGVGSLDLRLIQIVRLDRECARHIWQRLRKHKTTPDPRDD
jgi:hypothetical protein